MHISRTEFLDLCFDRLSTEQLLSRLGNAGKPYGYVVTPNVDHLVRLHKHRSNMPELVEAYRRADLCICDSRIVRRLALVRGVDLPVTTGSDLVRLLFQQVIQAGDKIAVVGGDGELMSRLRKRFPVIELVHHSAPMGLMQDGAARSAAAQFVADEGARFTFLCVGSPQQELIAAEAGAIPGARGTALCVGAALEFLVGIRPRAPEPMQRLGLEWLHRLLSDPRRLWRRYLVEGPRVFLLTLRWKRRTAQDW